MLLVIAAVVGLILRFIIPAIATQIPEYTFFSELGFDQLQDWYQYYRSYLPGEPLENTSLRELFSQLSTVSPNLVGGAMKLFTLSMDFFINLLLVIVAVIMMLSDPVSYRRMLIRAFPNFIDTEQMR